MVFLEGMHALSILIVWEPSLSCGSLEAW